MVLLSSKFRRLFLTLVFLIGLSSTVFSGEKQVVGWLEIVTIYPGDIKIKAKLDTGARNSSLHAKNIVEFKRDGKVWVRFDFRNSQKHMVTYEGKVIRTTKVKRLGQGAIDRPVIKLNICIGNKHREVEVNLEDRSGFNYQMLIGRSFLKGLFVIDPALMFTIEPQCQGVRVHE